MNRHLAVDIGASTMRMILGWLEHGQLEVQEVYRAPNTLENRNGHLCWDLAGLFDAMIAGLKECKRLNLIPDTIGIDTWAVDYVLLDEDNRILGDSVAYRDNRTEGMDWELEPVLPFERHYAICGIAKQPFNTVYQLMAQFREHPEHRTAARSFLMVPDYLGFLLTGRQVNEYTNCSSTAMLDARSRTWSREILRAAGLPEQLFSRPPVEPGTTLGHLTGQVQREVGFDAEVICPATHDTGSAFVAVPSREERAVYLSSGTWSLLGVENSLPRTDAAAMRSGFTNEGGYGQKIRFLKNIMGLWILQCIHRETGGTYSFSELAQLAETADGYPGRIDVNNSRFLAPSHMTQEVAAALREQGFPTPDLPQLLACVHHSLADCYAASIAELEIMLGRNFTCVNIIGGGSQNRYLNRLTAKATGLSVLAGPSEGTALGNLLVQMLNRGEFPSLQAARDTIAASFTIEPY